MRELVVIKLGGSILTNKGQRGPPRFRTALAGRLARALVRLHRRHDVVLILGAGSWGHPQALGHGVGARTLRGAAKARAFGEISTSIEALRSRFCIEALRAGLPVVPIAAHAVARHASRLEFSIEPFRWMVGGGLVPVTGGDVVEDARRGLRILSGDEIAHRLARGLRPRRVVFATDVEGVRVDGRVRSRMTRAEAARVKRSIGSAKDATGGMRGKLEHALRILGEGVEVRIVDGRRPEAVLRAARGAAEGTLLRP